MALGIVDDAIRYEVHLRATLASSTCFRVTDKEAVAMSRYIVQHDGLFLGSSSACNLVACIKVAKSFGTNSGRVIATILYVGYSRVWVLLTLGRCDSGSRHYSKVSDLASY
jgi:cysteine synthase A